MVVVAKLNSLFSELRSDFVALSYELVKLCLCAEVVSGDDVVVVADCLMILYGFIKVVYEIAESRVSTAAYT